MKNHVTSLEISKELACEKIMFFLNFEDELAEKVGAKIDKLPNCTLDELKDYFINKSKEGEG
jgi:hypothetical protein